MAGTRLIAGGARVRVVIDSEIVGLATQATYQEDWVVNPANVLNYLGPIDYDSQGYSCSITLGTFIPEIPGSGPWPDGGVRALSDFLVTRSQVQLANGKPGEFALLQIVNSSSGLVINQFEKVMLASNGVQASPNSYLTADIRFMAVSRTI